MAVVPLRPLGSSRDRLVSDAEFAKERDAVGALEDELEVRRSHVRSGWGQKYVDRVHGKGKLTARERIDALKDSDTHMFEVGTFVNWGETFHGGTESPGAGVITAFIQVHGRWCVVIANDNTVASGAWWPRTPQKIQRAQAMARRLGLPVLYLVDCSGLFLPEQSRTFGGAAGAGHIFWYNSVLSRAGVPQLSGVFGDCIAGGGYMPLISDRVFMTEGAYMVIAGAALIKGAKSQKLTSLDIGGPEVHVHQSGCADERCPDDVSLLRRMRETVATLPSSAVDYFRADRDVLAPRFFSGELRGIIPADRRHPYVADEVIARLCDQSLFWEVLSHVGREVMCGVGLVGGLHMGFVINRQGMVDDVNFRDGARPGATLYRHGIAKMSAFARACDEDGVPLIWLQDVSGFDIGVEAEREGLLGYGSSLIYANSTHGTPVFTVLLRKASGAGYYAMAGLPYDPAVQLSTVLARQGVMEGRTLAIATYNSRLDDDFRITTRDPAERAEVERGMAEVESRIEDEMDPYLAAGRLDTDEVVGLGEVRPWLCMLAEASYQGTGGRRSKNSRIWSLHDVDLMGGPHG